MPGKVKVKISSGKNLPVMDRSSDTTDAYVEIKLGSTTFKTDVCRKSLHPQWNTDWYKFEVDDSELQDEPLQIRLMDHDTYSANDAIGKVYLNLNPLLLPVDGQVIKYGFSGDSSIHHEISGWIPVYDTMHGIRGEVNVTVKVELFSDFNRFRQSSCGVQFFYSPVVPQGYHAKVIHGFVEELVVNDDPEYQWIDKIRTPRASNEARQTLFFKLSGELQRKIGVKTLNLGGNAVIGYKQSYDLEGESGIVARGIGTAVSLVKSFNLYHMNINTDESKEEHVDNYLKFIGGDKSFRLSITPRLHIPFPPLGPDTLSPLSAHPIYKQLSKRLYFSLDSGHAGFTHTDRDISNPSLTVLLKQEDKRGKPVGLSQKFKNFKYSQNTLSKKMTALKSKLGEGIGEDIVHDTPVGKKSYKKPKNNSSVMAELLARSAIHAHNSLSCILEVNHATDREDSEDTLEKLEPIANLLSKTVSEPALVSDDNGSVTCYSSSESSSSCSEDDDENNTFKNSDIETISNIIKDVEIIQQKHKPILLKQLSLPAMGPKSDSYDSMSINMYNLQTYIDSGYDLDKLTFESIEELNETQSALEDNEDLENFNDYEENDVFYKHNNDALTTSTEDVILYEKDSVTTHLDEPQDTETCSKDVQRIAERSKQADPTESSLVKNVSFNLMSTYTSPTIPSLEIVVKNHNIQSTVPETTIQNVEVEERGLMKTDLQGDSAMSINAPSKIPNWEQEQSMSAMEQQSTLLKYTGILNTSKTKDIQEQYARRSEYPLPNVVKVVDIEEKDLLKCAMQAMLLEKINLMSTYTPPPVAMSESDYKFSFPQNENKITDLKSLEADSNQESITCTHTLENVPHEEHLLHQSRVEQGVPEIIEHVKIDDQGLMKTAIQSMLLDKVSLIGTLTPPISQRTVTETDKPIKHLGAIPKTKIKKPPLKEDPNHVFQGVDIKETGLVNTAMQAMLLDKVSLMSAYTPPVSPTTESDGNILSPVKESSILFNFPEKHDGNTNIHTPTEKNQYDKTLFQTPMPCKENLLRSLHSHIFDVEENTTPTSRPKKQSDSFSCQIEDGADLANIKTNRGIPEAIKEVEVTKHGLIKTAMQTMLLDKVSLMSTYSPPTSPKCLSASEKRYMTHFHFPVNRAKLFKSQSSVSLYDYMKHSNNETVLGVSFSSTVALKDEYLRKQHSQPCLLDHNDFVPKTQKMDSLRRDKQTCFSDTHLDKPMLHVLLDKKRHWLKFLNLRRKTQSYDSSLNKPKTLLRFLSRSRKSSESGGKEHQSLISRIFSPKNKEKPESLTRILPASSQNNVTNTNETANNPSNIPVSVHIVTGTTCSETNNACITSNRHNTLLQPDLNGTDDRQSPDNLKKEQSPARATNLAGAYRRSSDSDLSVTPKGSSLTGSDKSGGHASGHFMRSNILLRSQIHQENFDMLEYPFLTIFKFPSGFIRQLGGAVSARSVKRLETITNIDEPESRDTWWSELRMEIRSHARSLNCNAVLGYTENSSICDDICILSACGTAAVIDIQNSDDLDENIMFKQNFHQKDIMSISLERTQIEKEKHNLNNNKIFDSPEHNTGALVSNTGCMITHLPYDSNNIPLKATVAKCALCGKSKVPEILIATIEPPDCIPSTGRGCFIDSYIYRPLKDLRGESIAKEISDGLPFLEYELHRLLINKLRIKGMNAIFGLKFRVSIGEKMIIGIATGTAVHLSSLPHAIIPKLVSDQISDDKRLAKLQKMLNDTVRKNREIYQINNENQNGRIQSDEDSDEEGTTLDLATGNKDCCVLEVDDPEDEELLRLLMEERPPDGFHVVNTENILGLEDLEIVKNLQMFTQIYRIKFQPPYNINKHFHRLLQSVYFKLRRMVPCALCNLQFRVDLPETDEVQLCVFGMALGLGKKQKKVKAALVPKRNDEDMIFKLDEDQIPENKVLPSNPSSQKSCKYKQKSPSKFKSQLTAQKERHGVDITPLSYVPDGNIERYLGNLNFFFIRETTSIREEGGLSGFIHSFVTEVLAIVRAHVTALGGNAMVAFFLTEIVLIHNLHKNQGQCLINVGGDVVSVSYFKEDT